MGTAQQPWETIPAGDAVTPAAVLAALVGANIITDSVTTTNDVDVGDDLAVTDLIWVGTDAFPDPDNYIPAKGSANAVVRPITTNEGEVGPGLAGVAEVDEDFNGSGVFGYSVQDSGAGALSDSQLAGVAGFSSGNLSSPGALYGGFFRAMGHPQSYIFGVEAIAQVTDDAAGYAEGLDALVEVDDSTISAVYAISAAVNGNGAGTVIAEAYGIWVGISEAGGSTNDVTYGVYLGALAGTVVWGFYQSGNEDNYFGGKLLTASGIGVGNSAAATIPGNVTDKIEVFDETGASLGFIAVYDAIT